MFDKELKVLEIINKTSSVSQREIAAKTNMSIGKVNSIIKYLEEEQYIRIEKIVRKALYNLTEKGLQALENHFKSTIDKKILISKDEKKSINQAVILAAGEGQGFDVPVVLLNLGESNVLRRTLNILKENNIEKIVIIIGYEYSQFKDFKNQPGIFLVENHNYKRTGTMASLALAKDYIDDDFLLIEGDMVFEEKAIEELLNNENRDCVLITEESGSGDEVFVELRNNFIFKASKDKHQFNRIDGEMIGLSKISIEIYNKMLEEFKKNQNPYLNYEYAILDVARTYNIGYSRLENLIWTEIDTLWQYKNLINYIYPILNNKSILK